MRIRFNIGRLSALLVWECPARNDPDEDPRAESHWVTVLLECVRSAPEIREWIAREMRMRQDKILDAVADPRSAPAALRPGIKDFYIIECKDEPGLDWAWGSGAPRHDRAIPPAAAVEVYESISASLSGLLAAREPFVSRAALICFLISRRWRMELGAGSLRTLARVIQLSWRAALIARRRRREIVSEWSRKKF